MASDVKKMRRQVIFNKACAIGWAIFGGLSFLFGWQNSVALVWIASVYANGKTDWGTAEAADDTEVLEELKANREELKANRKELKDIREMLEKIQEKINE